MGRWGVRSRCGEVVRVLGFSKVIERARGNENLPLVMPKGMRRAHRWSRAAVAIYMAMA